jgi:tetratricopeptide (TPR) repeat protein
MGRDEQAGAILQQARTLGSNEPHAHIALAEVESLIGDEAAAEAHLRRAWEIEPNGEAWIRLALLLARRGRGGEVIATANEVRARWAGDERLGALVDQLEGLVAPDVHLVADGERIEPASADSKCWRFKLPRAARHVVIASRSCVPARTHNGARDARCLGVPVKRIVLRSTHAEMDVRHDHPLLGEGFHPCEGGQRWTNGAGRIPDALLAAMSDVDSVEVHLSSLSLQYSAFGR